MALVRNSATNFRFRPFVLILRGVQALLTLLVLALVAATIAKTNDIGFYFSIDAYALFVAIFTLIILVFPLSYILFYSYIGPALVFTWVLVSAEILTNIFWFASWIALASLHGPENCDFRFFVSNYCKVGKAATAFAAITWATFVATSVLVVLEYLPTLKVTNTHRDATVPVPADAEANPGLTTDNNSNVVEKIVHPSAADHTVLPTTHHDSSEHKNVIDKIVHPNEDTK